MAGSYEELSAAFNQSARDLVRLEPDATWLVTRYTTLLKFKATGDEQKAALTGMVLTCFEDYLKKHTAPDLRWISGESEPNLKQLAAVLSSPDSLKHIPESAAQRLADLSLALLDQSKKIAEEDSIPYNRREEYADKITRFAGIALRTAEAVQSAAFEVDVKTSKNIAPAKRITLKTP